MICMLHDTHFNSAIVDELLLGKIASDTGKTVV